MNLLTLSIHTLIHTHWIKWLYFHKLAKMLFSNGGVRVSLSTFSPQAYFRTVEAALARQL